MILGMNGQLDMLMVNLADFISKLSPRSKYYDFYSASDIFKTFVIPHRFEMR